MAVFTPRALQIPNMRTDYSAENSAFSNLGQTLGSMPSEFRKEQLNAQKQQILGQIGTGNLDYEKAGRSLIALGDTQAGATLLTLGQKQQERDLEKSWLSGGGGLGAAPTQPLGSASASPGKMPPSEIKAIIDANVPEADREYAYRMAQKESSFNPGAVSPTGAKGLFQFTGGTGRQYGLVDRAGDIRDNPTANTQAFARFTEDNRQTLRQALGRDPTYGELALAHQQGAGGAIALITGKGDVNPNNLRVNNADPNAPRSESARRIMAYYGYGNEQPAPSQTSRQPAQVAQANVPGDDPVKLRSDAQYYAQSNPEAARQLNARADALERGNGGQVAQAPGAADLPPQGANATPTQGFAIPGGENEFQQRSILSDKNVQLWQQRLNTAPTERTRTIAQTNLNLAIKDAEQRYAEGKAPEAVREWQYARRNGLTDAKSPVAYAKEKADATRADTAPVTRQIKQADGSEVVVQWNPDARRWDPLTAPEGGEAVRPKGQKLTEGQSKDLIFHNRGIQALEAFEPVADAYAVGVDRVAAQVPGGNYIVPENFQKAQQAGRNFLASILRKDSGAAITVPEENQYGAIFLPQPGDKPGTLAQKAEARKQAIDAIRNGLGTAEVLALGQRLTTRNPGEAAPPPVATPAKVPPQQLGQPQRVTTIEDARKLPSGTEFVDPNGVRRRVP